jgi:hypothetical protein
MRLAQNGEGCEVIFTLFQTTDMSNELFIQDFKMVEKDPNRSKSIIEKK